MGCILDHIAVAAPTLEAGAAFVTKTLGVSPQAGGEHPRMGTHNLLLRLGDLVYLEVIAANPAAPAPGRPRWFALDSLPGNAVPFLAAWVARTEDIRTWAEKSPEPLGPVESMSRGTLQWLITIPEDGSLPLGPGPALIQWQPGVHPASKLQDHGLHLVGLDIHHPDPKRVSRLLESLAMEGPLSVKSLPGGAAPYLEARIETPRGVRVLRSAE